MARDCARDFRKWVSWWCIRVAGELARRICLEYGEQARRLHAEIDPLAQSGIFAPMRIQFCGADRTVTGTCHLLEINGLHILLDFGMYQGPRDEARLRNQFMPDDATHADAVILTHAHFDHCGKLPMLVKKGYKGPIYCTPATAAMAQVVLEDAGQIQEEDAEYLNRRAVRPNDGRIEPLYRRVDVPGVFKLFRNVPYAKKTDLGKGVFFTFLDAGHILGSAYVMLEWTEQGRARTLLFTADVGRYNTPILGDPKTLAGPVEQVITESTYGNSSHGPIADVGPQFLDAVRYCIQKRSRLVIPSFAVGRTQTVLWYMQKFVQEKLIPEIPVFVDSPMGVRISEIHKDFPEDYDDQTRAMLGKNDLFGLARVSFCSTPQQSKQINTQAGPCVIIASSPSCEFGRVLHHLVVSVERPDDLVVFVGWIPPQTLGRRLQEGQKRVRILDRWYDVSCQTRTIHGLSAHADGDELLRFLGPTLKGQTTAYVVHGEVEQAETFAGRLLGAGVGRAIVPAMETSVVV
jgi:metallo-beta-lactamase family protein